ncbi:PREDICTED: caspase-8 [Vollenhovia emeryi]|uniref:caspase-8 n=1 Tax=Vollenhovia emeryi TaxID=411798 RepID=UPI0005F460CD|nr:PREDICTED: caspase-8 [Vollenhovia emeryi]
MMSLLVDAITYREVVAEHVININILRQIEDDLDIDEKISILFLIIDNYGTGFNTVFKLFQIHKTKDAYIIADYVKNHPENWEEKILEALCILNNREILRKLKVSFSDLELQYFPKVIHSRNINIVAKCLYKLCESLDEKEENLLLNYVKSENCNYESLLDNVDYLELHMLYWIQIGYITISKDKLHNIKKLLKHLKEFKDGRLKIICIELEKFETNLHVVDNCGNFRTNDKNYLQSTSPEESTLTERHLCKKTINSGLCIIINQIHFRKEYETRYGTEADCITLCETFKAFGFKVVILQNLKRNKMLEKLRNISKDHGQNYDCLFLCILSHGYKGGVIASDEKEISLETIEKTICCIELREVIKIVIIQACQGKTQGINHLRTDSLSDSFAPVEEREEREEDIRQFDNFCMFMSTMQGFLSIRHKEEGSWFIQEVCKIFKTYGNELTFFDCVRKIMKSVREKEGTIDGNQIAQSSEIRVDRLLSDFQLKQSTLAV